jgi:hypothetical protein
MARALTGWAAAVLLALPGFAETIRVTSWNLQLKPGATAETQAQLKKEAAETLKKLQPDVILLQGVRDWAMCEDLAQELRPADYRVAVCSSLHSVVTAETNALQVAILTKARTYFTLAEAWHFQGEIKLPGGYTFAAFQNGDYRFGVFSLQMGGQQMPALTARQLVDELEVVRKWEANQVNVFLIAGTLNTVSRNSATVYDTLTRLLGEAGFADALVDLPPAQRSTLAPGPGQSIGPADFILVETNATGINPQITATSLLEHYPITCDVELKPQIVLAQSDVQQSIGTSNAPATEGLPEQMKSAARAVLAHLPGNRVLAWSGGLFGALLLLCALIWVRTRRKPLVPARAPALLPASAERESKGAPASYTVIIAPRSVTGSAAEPTADPSTLKPVIHVESPGSTHTHGVGWTEAEAAMRAGLMSQLSQWLKQKLVRKLMVDRAQLLQAQEEAARKALKVDERLNRIERQIQQQNQAYERRIEDLNRQLLAAKEENRELIRYRIAQIKTEMEQARVRLLAKAQEENDG